MHIPRSALRLGLAAAVTSLIAGCSAASSLTSSTLAPASSATSSAAALSGPQLANILLPAKSLPSGYKVNASGTLNTASQLPSDSAQPMPASKVCQTFTQTSYIRAAGINTGTWAQSDYVNADNTGEIAQEIDVFTGTDAQQAMTTLWQEWGKCASFTYPSNGTTVSSTLTRSRIPGQGDDAIKAVIVSPTFQGGFTLAAIRIGSQIVTTLYSSPNNDLGAPSVGYAEQIAKRLRAAE